MYPRGRDDTLLQGIFATRPPQHSNPTGLTLVRLVERKQNILVVEGLDAYDRTPILDIKPYDHWNSAIDIRVPEWRRKL